MSLISDTVLDEALDYVATNGVEAEVQTAADAVLVDGVTLDSSNYGTVGDNGGAGGGRKVTALVNDSNDMDNIAVTTSGTASKVVIKDGSGNVLIEADLSAPVALTTSDTVNIGTTDIILKDPS